MGCMLHVEGTRSMRAPGWKRVNKVYRVYKVVLALACLPNPAVAGAGRDPECGPDSYRERDLKVLPACRQTGSPQFTADR